MADSTSSIMRSARRFFGGTMLSRCSGMLRDISMATVFGTQESIAAFLVAFRFAHLLRRLFGEGAMQTAFIPQFEELRLESPERAGRFFRDLFALLTVSLSFLIIISMLFLGAALYWIDLSTGNYEIVQLTLLLMPSLLFICLFGLNASLLQCEKRFFMAGFAPVAFNLIWSIGVFSLWKQEPSQAMSSLAFWVIIACLSQWLITVPQVLQSLRSNQLQHFIKGVSLFSSDLKRLVKPLFLAILGVAASQVNNAMDAIFARYASLEGPAYLWYALRIQQLPLALFGIAIAGALLPPLTRALKSNHLATYYQFQDFALRRSFALMLPITFAIFLMGSEAIQLIYGRGDFNSESVVQTAACLTAYSAGLIPMTLVLIIAPAFYAINDYRTPATASVISVVVNLLLNALLIMRLGFGAESVAWSTSVSACVNLAWLLIKLPHAEVLQSRLLWKSLAKVTLCTVMATGVLLMFNLETVYSKHLLTQAWQFGNRAGVFTLALGLFAWLFKADDLLRLAGNDSANSAPAVQKT